MEGKSLVEAIKEKYSDCHENSEHNFIVFVKVPKSAPGKRSDGSIIVPQDLVMSSQNITCAGDESEIAELCGNITSLDLENNSIKDLKEVFNILKQTPECCFLSLRANPLTVDFLQENLPDPIESIVELVLNEVNIPFKCVMQLLKVFPNVSNLHLSVNGYEAVDFEESYRNENVKVLHFGYNKIKNWEEVEKLGKIFPNLETLNLIKNPLCNLPQTKELGAEFQKLTFVNLIDTKLKEWGELEQFRYFPAMNHVKISGVPLLENKTEEVRRMLTLSYLPNLVFLSGSRLTAEEKENAERAFVRFYMDHVEKPERYYELHEKLGDLDPLAEVDLGAGENEATVTVALEDKTVLFKVDLNWTVVQLRKELRKLFDIPVGEKFKLFYEDPVYPMTSGRMIYLDRPLRRYQVKDGDRLFLNMS